MSGNSNKDLRGKQASSTTLRPNNAQDIKYEIDRITQLLNSNEIENGLRQTRELVKQHATNIEVLNFWGNVEEQLGSLDEAIKAHRKSIQVKPDSPISYLNLGYLLATSSKVDPVLKQEVDYCFSLLLDLAPAWFFQLHEQNFSSLVKQKVVYAGRRLVQLFDTLHIEAVGDSSDTIRVKNAVWPQTHLKPFTYNYESQKPHLFYVPELKAIPIWPLREFLWANEFMAQYPSIAEEFHSTQTLEEMQTRPYLDTHFGANSDLEELAGQSSWTALDLYKEGKRSPFAEKYFPKTLKALEALPLSGRGERPDEVFFSILQPGQEIPPHFGLSNHSLTVHLGIDIPGGELTVADEHYCWKEAELVVFDDSFLHSAINDTEKVRVVLLFSIWHPDLSDKEILAIKRAFNYRQSWLEQRYVGS
ncbi:aspartyl/asparaginyl beta-hydroxylase domain-containing protein [Alteromonas sp. W364]|jgi:hypothetical protein|uniref:aspartyl/asparaginyl beta-hydroxylase domain-containing protein n=1 Tax=Alteromonas sp. W364 TaxID=3075610 RepID=UPI002888508A|nr:aspartyl/asparaginyl beta-hydroxylase domain-containing protein [Alteromonas sp. W364]MDT0628320.1 aspartyl/asparaginyl beta-hydroxylase domain-containing protein [Alteromonas sp. W364]